MYDENYQIFPIHLTSFKQPSHVNLLIIEKNQNQTFESMNPEVEDVIVTKRRKLQFVDPQNSPMYHYVWIKDISRLMQSQLTTHGHKIYFCDRCMHFLYNEDKFKKHTIDCENINQCKVKLPSPLDKKKSY